MPRSIRLADKLGAAAGLAFTVLMFISVAVVDPKRGVSDQELQSWWADSGNRNGLVISMYTMLVACPLFLLFISRLRKRLQVADVSGWSEVVLSCGIAMTTALGVVAAVRGVIAGSMRFEDEPLPGIDTLRFQTGLVYAVWDVAILFAAVLIAVASILAIVTRVLPRWLGGLGVVVAVGSAVLVAVHIAPFSLPLIYIWVLASSVQLVREPATAPVDVQSGQTAVSSARA
jgi:hypothetical protein